jgi:hypothetical protein
MMGISVRGGLTVILRAVFQTGLTGYGHCAFIDLARRWKVWFIVFFFAGWAGESESTKALLPMNTAIENVKIEHFNPCCSDCTSMSHGLLIYGF